MKCIQRSISFLLALVMVFSMVPPMEVRAEETEPIGETEAVMTVEETTVPTEAVTEPVEETTVPIEIVTEPAEEIAVPTEVVTEPTEETTAPTEPVTESAQGETAPTEETVAEEPEVIPVESAIISQAEGISELAVGETLQLTATVLPENATDQTVVWSSSDETVATVNQNGIVTAISLGYVTVSITHLDIHAHYSITIKVKQEDIIDIYNSLDNKEPLAYSETTKSARMYTRAYEAMAANSEEVKYSNLLLDINWNNIYTVGTQKESGPCGAFAVAYSRTLLDKQIHYYTEYYKNGLAQWGEADYERKSISDKNEAYRRIYSELCGGNPVVVKVNSSSNDPNVDHYVAVVGFENVTSLNELSAHNFLILDSGVSKQIVYNMSEKYDIKKVNNYHVIVDTTSATVSFKATASGYQSQCDQYPCSGTLEIIDPCYMYTLPCNPDTASELGYTSEPLTDQRLLPENDPKLEVIALYKNTKGSYWYEVMLDNPLSDGQETAYVWSEKGEFNAKEPWLAGGEFPEYITGGTNMKGVVTIGEGGRIDKVWATVNRGKGTSGTEVMRTNDHTVPGTTYDLYGSDLDNDIPFGTLPGDGFYTLNVYASYTCYSANDGTAKNVGSSMVLLEDFYFEFEGNKDYIIDFNANGGSCSESERTITKGDAIGTLPTPTRSGFTFDGWYTALTGGSKVTANTVPDSGMTLYARWVYGDAFYLPTSDPYVFIKHRESGHGLSNVNGNVELGVYGETGSLWQLVGNADDTYTIVSAVDGTVVDIYNNDTADGTNIGTYSSNGTSAQKWYLKKIGTGYSFVSANSLKVLDIYDAGTALGSNAQLYVSNDSSAQIFDLEMALGGVVTPSTKTVDLVVNQSGSQTVELTYSGSSDDVKLTTSGMNGIVECSFGVFEDGKWPLTITALRAGTCTVGISAYDTSTSSYIEGCSIQVSVTVNHEGTKLNFNPNGGTIPGPVLTDTYSGINRSRGPKDLIIYNNKDSYLANMPNEYGVELAVSPTGKVIAYRDLGDENGLGFPDNGFIVSGHAQWDDDSASHLGGALFGWGVESLMKTGDVYVSVDYENGLVKAFDSYAGYLNETKRCQSGSQYGVLPIPVRSGYIFNGWQVNGINVNYFSSFAGASLSASWSAESSLTPSETMEYNGHTYERYDSIVTWEKAKEICEAKGGHLVVITDAAENAAVTSLATKGIRGLYSIGLTDKDSVGTWKWTTEEPFSYDNWDPQYPEPEYEPEKNYGILVAIDNPPNKQVGEWLNTFNEFHSDNFGERFYDQSNVGFICEYEGPAACSHSYNAVVTKPTCTAQGYTTHTCSKCGDSYVDTYVAATGHSYSYTVSKAPTTAAAGTLQGTCGKCSGTTTVTLPKLDTTQYTYKVIKTETCTAEGSGRYTWNTTTYGSFYFDVVRAKLEHSYTSKVTAPTCTERGYTTHTCSVCGNSYVDAYVNATDHKWDSGKVTTAATCTKDGVKTYICTSCSATKTEVIGATGHSYSIVVTAPTCTEQGYTTHTCSKCNDCYVDTYVAATDHKWNSGEVTTAAICTKDGVKTYTCTVCSATKTEVITSLGHSYNAVVTAPTCTEQGYTTHTCVCGDSYVDSYVDALNHNFESGKCTRCNTVDPDYKKGSCGENLTWVLDENGILTISGTGAMSEFTSSTQPWAEYMDDVFHVIVEDGVTTVSQYAFFKCSNLETVKISDTVTDIGIWAFAYCLNLRNVDIGEGVTIIQTRVFSDCTALTELTIGSNVTRIMQWPFADCTSLKNIVLPETLTRIDAYAFQNCSSLTDVTLPAALDTFSYGVFGGCSNLNNINVAEDNASFCSVDGVVYNKNKTRIVEVPGGRSGKFIIPDSVTSVEEYAFYECRFITEIIIPDSVRLLNSHAFHGCDGLTQIIIPESVYGVYVGAFSYCSNLKEIEFLGNAPSFRVDVFKNVTATIYYPANNTTWTEDVRQQYSGTIIWESYDPCAKNGHDYEDLVTEPDCTEKGYTTHTCSVCGDSYVDAYVDALGHNYVDGICSICGGENPDTVVTVIDSGTCGTRATWVLTSDGTLNISGTGAMGECGNIKRPWMAYEDFVINIVIEEGITTIAQFAFTYFDHVETIQIPETVIGIAEAALNCCAKLTSIILPEGLKSIGVGAIAGCLSLEKIVIPPNVTSIERLAFTESKGLKEVYFEGNAPSFGDRVFGNVTATVYYPANNSTWTSDVMQDYGGSITWLPYGFVENRVTVNAVDLDGQTSVWIDGVEYAVQTDGDSCYVDLLDGNAKNMVAYTYHAVDSFDIHTQYPVSMKVWTLSNEDGLYTATRVEELDDILQYSGASIRVTGKKGIRMITSMNQTKKNDLISDGLAGYTLKEYGTVVAWASQLGDDPLVLGESYAKSNYAYKKDVADPVFAYEGNLMQYTNVLVGFSTAQCKNDLVMRPYMILEDTDGSEMTIYGGTVTRSIGYIALQNRDTFAEGTEAYNYVWNIIRSVYGDAYNEVNAA